MSQPTAYGYEWNGGRLLKPASWLGLEVVVGRDANLGAGQGPFDEHHKLLGTRDYVTAKDFCQDNDPSKSRCADLTPPSTLSMEI